MCDPLPLPSLDPRAHTHDIGTRPQQGPRRISTVPAQDHPVSHGTIEEGLHEAPVAPRDPAKIPGRFYLRLNVEDRPGVLAKIAGILGQHEISIASVIQHETAEDGDDNVVPLVIMTHSASEGAMAAAIDEIDRSPFVHGGTVRMRVLD